MPVERRERVIAFEIGSTGNGRSPIFNGRRQPSCGGTSRMMREYQVRICERLGVKLPGPTRQYAHFAIFSACPVCHLSRPKKRPQNFRARKESSVMSALAPISAKLQMQRSDETCQQQTSTTVADDRIGRPEQRVGVSEQRLALVIRKARTIEQRHHRRPQRFSTRDLRIGGLTAK